MEANGPVALRSAFLSILASLFLFLLAMSFVGRWDGGDERWVPRAVAALGVLALAATAWVRRRPLGTGSPEALAGSYRARFFIGVDLTQSAARSIDKLPRAFVVSPFKKYTESCSCQREVRHSYYGVFQEGFDTLPLPRYWYQAKSELISPPVVI